jgi:hypothetical protein
LGFVGVLLFLYKKIRKDNKNNIQRQAQEAYNALKKSNTPVLSAKERLSLSWEPIKKLAEYIIGRFSDTDKNQLIVLGEKLLKHGAKYIHVVDYAVPRKNYSRVTEQEQKQDIDKNQLSR